MIFLAHHVYHEEDTDVYFASSNVFVEKVSFFFSFFFEYDFFPGIKLLVF